MKLFDKKVSLKGRTRIYFCGIKIASFDNYYKKHLKNFLKKTKINFENKNIISLGCNCFSRTLLTVYGLKRKKDMGELSYPFDLAIHRTDELANLFKNKFADFLSGLYFDEQRGCWKNKVYGFSYIHDEDCGKDDFEKISIRLGNRLKNLKKAFKEDKTSVFVLYLDLVHVMNDKPKAEYVKSTVDLIKEILDMRKNKKSVFIIISNKPINIKMDNVYVLYAKLPWKTYIWANPERYTRDGSKYELKIANFCYNILSKC